MMTEYARHSRFSDPGPYRGLLAALPDDLPALTAVVRNVLVHYRAAGITFTGDRLAEIDNRWVERILGIDQRRFGAELAAPRPLAERVAGCCRDFTLLTVAALRERGVPARSRIGFAGYFRPPFHDDHVIVEYRTAGGWAFVDAQLDPSGPWPWDPSAMPRVVVGRLGLVAGRGGPRRPVHRRGRRALARRRRRRRPGGAGAGRAVRH